MNWDHFVGYLEATEKMAAEVAKTDEGQAARRKLLEEAKALFAELRTAANNNRGPYLALVELEKRMSTGPETLLAALTAFVAQFSTKSSCALDIRPYAEELVLRRGVTSGDLAKRLEAAALGSSPEGESLIYARIFVLELQRMLGLHASPAEMLAAANASLELFDSSKPADHGAPTAGDEAVLICYASLLDHSRATKSVAALYDAAAMLEAALARNENACQARLCLIDCYLRLGALRPAAQHMWAKQLGVKNILVESVSHLIVGEGERHGDLQNFISSFIDAILSLHRENEFLVPDKVIEAYTVGSLAKVSEFFRFRAKLQRSSVFAFARTESVLLPLPSVSPVVAAERLSAIAPAALPPLPSPADDTLECTSDLDAALFSQWDAIPTPAKQPPQFLSTNGIRIRRCALRTLASATRSDAKQTLSLECAALLETLPNAGLALVAVSDVAPANLEASAWTLFTRAVQMAIAGFALLAADSQEQDLPAYTESFAVFNTQLIAVSKALRSYVEDASRLKFAERLPGIATCITQGLHWCSIVNHSLLSASEALVPKQKQKHKGQQTAASTPTTQHQQQAAQAVRERCRSVTAALGSFAQTASDVISSIAALPPDHSVPVEPLAKLPTTISPRRATAIRDVAASQGSTLDHFQHILAAFKVS